MAEPLMNLRGSKVATNDWRPNELAIYEDRIEETKKNASISGLLGKQARQVLRYEQVANVALAQGIRWSTLTVESTGGARMILKGLSRAEAQRAKELIEERLVASRAPAAPTHATEVSAADELMKLSALRDQGVLTEEEFVAAKKKILGLDA